LTLTAFVLFALLCRGALEVLRVEYPHPSQRASLEWATLLPIFALGLVGAWLAPRAGLSAGPVGRIEWRRAILHAVTIGLAFGTAAVALDLLLGVSHLLAAKLGTSKIHLAFPASIFAYAVGATVVECLYRIIPIPVLLGLWRLVGRGAAMGPAFWIVAILTSLIEPLSQAGFFRNTPAVFGLLGAFIFGVNLTEAWLLRRYGVAAPLLVRFALYFVWHITVGPLVVGV